MGLAMGILAVLNAGPVLRRTAWVEPSWGARIFVFYLPAIWAVGSIFSALLLGLTRSATRLTRLAIRLCRRGILREAAPALTLTAAGSFGRPWRLSPQRRS